MAHHFRARPAQGHVSETETDDSRTSDVTIDLRAHAALDLVDAYWNATSRMRELRSILDAGHDARTLRAEWEAVREDLAAVISKVSPNDVPERVALCALVDERIETQIGLAHARIMEIEPERAALAAELKAIRAGLTAVSAAVGDVLFNA
jgi:hypothetical protein